MKMIYRIVLRRNGEIIDSSVYSSLERAVSAAKYCRADHRESYGGHDLHKLYIVEEEDDYGSVYRILTEDGRECFKSDYERDIQPRAFLHAEDVPGSGRWEYRSMDAALRAIPKHSERLGGKRVFLLTDYDETISLGRFNERGERIDQGT